MDELAQLGVIHVGWDDELAGNVMPLLRQAADDRIAAVPSASDEWQVNLTIQISAGEK